MRHPCVILVKPTLSQNIGAVTRAMMNFGLTDLRLVAPKADWLNPEARSLSAGADQLLDTAQVFDTFDQAIQDLQYLYATTARPRDMNKTVYSPRELMNELIGRAQNDLAQGFVFGNEKSGLDNEDIARCDAIITIPLNPTFSSINLAQSLIVVAYEYYQGCRGEPPAPTLTDAPAPRAELEGLFSHLEDELMKSGYLRPAHKIPIMVRTLRNMLSRAQFSSQEVRSFRGVISSLVNPHGIYSRRPKRLLQKNPSQDE